jgi:hypothetical protein
LALQKATDFFTSRTTSRPNCFYYVNYGFKTRILELQCLWIYILGLRKLGKSYSYRIEHIRHELLLCTERRLSRTQIYQSEILHFASKKLRHLHFSIPLFTGSFQLNGESVWIFVPPAIRNKDCTAYVTRREFCPSTLVYSLPSASLLERWKSALPVLGHIAKVCESVQPSETSRPFWWFTTGKASGRIVAIGRYIFIKKLS